MVYHRSTTLAVGNDVVDRGASPRRSTPRAYLVFAVLLMAMSTLLVTVDARPASAGSWVNVTVAGKTCSVRANNPHKSTGENAIKGQGDFGRCTSAVSSITPLIELQKCTHSSSGCLWSRVGTPWDDNIVGGHTGITTRPVRKACPTPAGHFRVRARITVYSGGNSKTSGWAYSQNPSGGIHVSC